MAFSPYWFSLVTTLHKSTATHLHVLVYTLSGTCSLGTSQLYCWWESSQGWENGYVCVCVWEGSWDRALPYSHPTLPYFHPSSCFAKFPCDASNLAFPALDFCCCFFFFYKHAYFNVFITSVLWIRIRIQTFAESYPGSRLLAESGSRPRYFVT